LAQTELCERSQINQRETTHLRLYVTELSDAGFSGFAS